MTITMLMIPVTEKTQIETHNNRNDNYTRNTQINSNQREIITQQ